MLGERFGTFGIAVDLFLCSLDQVGLYEIEALSRKTGGLVLQSTSFSNDLFAKTLCQVVEMNDDDTLSLALQSHIEVHCTRRLKISGAILNGTKSSATSETSISENFVGLGGTNAWKVAMIDKFSTFSLSFDVVNAVCIFFFFREESLTFFTFF
jgi:protein transport protein SEC23